MAVGWSGIGLAQGYPWPMEALPSNGSGPLVYLGDAGADAPPPLAPGCVGCILPPTGSAHPAVTRMRRWLDAAAAAAVRPLCIYRPEGVPGDPQRYRLLTAFAHVCGVLGLPCAVEVPSGSLAAGHPLGAGLARWPDVRVAVWVSTAGDAAAAVGAWGQRLALVVAPAAVAPEVRRAWAEAAPGAEGWVVAGPAGGGRASLGAARSRDQGAQGQGPLGR